MATNRSTAHIVLEYSVWVKSNAVFARAIDTSGQLQSDAGTVAKIRTLQASQFPPIQAIKVLILRLNLDLNAQLESDSLSVWETVGNGDYATDVGTPAPFLGR